MALKQIAGVLSMLVGLGPGAVTYLAATNRPVPILGPMVGYDPTAPAETDVPGLDVKLPDVGGDAGSSSSDPGMVDLPTIDGDSSSSVPEVLNPDDIITPDSGYADALIDLVMQPEYSSTGITATKTANSDPEQVILNLIGYTYEILYLTDATTVVSYDFKFTNAMSEAEMQGVIEAESKGFPLVYRMLKESFGEPVTEGQDDFTTLVNGSSLFPVLNPPTFDELSAQLKDFSFDTPAFTMELVGLNTAIEGQLTGQIRMTIRPTENMSSGIAPDDETSPADQLQPGETTGDPANASPSSTDESSQGSSDDTSSETEPWGAGDPASSSSSTPESSAPEITAPSSGTTNTPYTGRHYVK